MGLTRLASHSVEALAEQRGVSRIVRPDSAAAAARGLAQGIGPLLLVGLALGPVTWWLPLFTARVPFLWRQDVSIASGLVELWRLDWPLFAAVLLFSVVAPLVKAVALVWVWYRVPADRCGRLLDRLALLGKLAMTEVFLLAVIIVGLKGVGIGKVETAWGLPALVLATSASFAVSLWAMAALRAAATPPSPRRGTGRP